MDLVDKVDWNKYGRYLIIPPTHHLVRKAYGCLVSYVQERGLRTHRHQLSTQEADSFQPHIQQTSSVYYICIAKSKQSAKSALDQYRFDDNSGLQCENVSVRESEWKYDMSVAQRSSTPVTSLSESSLQPSPSKPEDTSIQMTGRKRKHSNEQ